MADFTYAGLYAPGTLVLADEEGNLAPAAAATVAILNSSSETPTFYTNRTKGGTTTPDFVTDANGNWGPYFIDPGAGYTYTVVDAQGNSHGPYSFTVNPDPEESTVTFVDYTVNSLTITTGVEWHNTTAGSQLVLVPVVYTPTGSDAAILKVGLSASTIGSAGPTDSEFPISGPVVTLTHRFIVPPGWYLRLDVDVNNCAVIQAGSYQAIAA